RLRERGLFTCQNELLHLQLRALSFGGAPVPRTPLHLDASQPVCVEFGGERVECRTAVARPSKAQYSRAGTGAGDALPCLQQSPATVELAVLRTFAECLQVGSRARNQLREVRQHEHSAAVQCSAGKLVGNAERSGTCGPECVGCLASREELCLEPCRFAGEGCAQPHAVAGPGEPHLQGPCSRLHFTLPELRGECCEVCLVHCAAQRVERRVYARSRLDVLSTSHLTSCAARRIQDGLRNAQVRVVAVVRLIRCGAASRRERERNHVRLVLCLRRQPKLWQQLGILRSLSQ